MLHSLVEACVSISSLRLLWGFARWGYSGDGCCGIARLALMAFAGLWRSRRCLMESDMRWKINTKNSYTEVISHAPRSAYKYSDTSEQNHFWGHKEENCNFCCNFYAFFKISFNWSFVFLCLQKSIYELNNFPAGINETFLKLTYTFCILDLHFTQQEQFFFKFPYIIYEKIENSSWIDQSIC